MNINTLPTNIHLPYFKILYVKFFIILHYCSYCPHIQQYFSSYFLMVTEPQDLTCYIHNMSPIKKTSNRQYFNRSLQTQASVIPAVCFSPHKYSEFTTAQATKTQVKLTNFKCCISLKALVTIWYIVQKSPVLTTEIKCT